MQQLRKSYSLSDLTGEKEDENRNHEHSPDEVDLDGNYPRNRSIFCNIHTTYTNDKKIP